MAVLVQVTPRSADQINLIADRVTAAFTDGDETQLREVFSARFRMWHNTDQQERDLAEALQLIAGVRARYAIEHTDVRRTLVPGGYLQESVIRFTTHAGAVYAAPACILVELDPDGRVSCAREYTDSAGLPPAFYPA